MAKITTEQALQVMGTLMANADWSKVDFNKADLQQAVITDPKGAGERFIAFLMNGASMQAPTESKIQAAKPASKTSVLKLVNDNVQFDAVITPNDPHAFYQTRTGFWVSDDFKSRILTKAKPIETLDAVTLSSFELKKSLYDREITPELGENYIFDESELCARIEQMISKQPNGEKGNLLNNGYANLFYVAGCVVGVSWRPDYRGWGVYAWWLDDDRWHAGRRVFSRN